MRNFFNQSSSHYCRSNRVFGMNMRLSVASSKTRRLQVYSLVGTSCLLKYLNKKQSWKDVPSINMVFQLINHFLSPSFGTTFTLRCYTSVAFLRFRLTAYITYALYIVNDRHWNKFALMGY